MKEKDHFKNVIGYIKYEQLTANSVQKEELQNELEFWRNYHYHYNDTELSEIPTATATSIEKDFHKEFSSKVPPYNREPEVAKLLENDFDKLL